MQPPEDRQRRDEQQRPRPVERHCSTPPSRSARTTSSSVGRAASTGT
jgi:hypothetical protein